MTLEPLSKKRTREIEKLTVNRRALRAIPVLPSCIEAQGPEKKIARWRDDHPLEPGERYEAWKGIEKLKRVKK